MALAARALTAQLNSAARSLTPIAVWPAGWRGAVSARGAASAASLYERMGGEAKIRALVSDIYDFHLDDPLTSPYFGADAFAKNTGDARRVKERVFQFFSSGIGGPHKYEGEDMVSAHRHMKIDGHAYHAVAYHVLRSMHERGAGGRAECEEVHGILESLQPDVLSGSTSGEGFRPEGLSEGAAGGEAPSLYERMGGEAKLRPLVSDIYDAHRSDPLTAPYFGAGAFAGNTGDHERVKDSVFRFFSSGIGGPHTYEGKDMISTHRGMKIEGQAWHAVVYHVLRNMADHQTGGRVEREEVFSILMSLKDDVLSGTSHGGTSPASLRQ